MTNFLDDFDKDDLPTNLVTSSSVDRMVESAKKPRNIRHSKDNPNWETKETDIAMARIALGPRKTQGGGSIALDPFSCLTGNLRVRADRYFGPDNNCDGFLLPWEAETVFENHPGGTTKRAWNKTCAEFRARHFDRLIWIGFSVEQVCILSEPDPRSFDDRWAAGVYYPTDFSLCFLRQRMHFIDPRDLTRPSRPGHANFVCGVNTAPEWFDHAYRGVGQVVHGEWTRRQFNL